ncbi:MAG TPA: hypothetical protein VNZ44_14895, partial [Pyrinomonadaceae bacterium]|nr:hypothetical protein [Pyrinomonadaceae bacterium]
MKIRRTPFASLLVLIALCAQASAQVPAPDARQSASRLAGAVLVGGRSMEYLKGLADGFGGRLTASP